MRVEKITFSADGQRAVVVLAPGLLGRLLGEPRLCVPLEAVTLQSVVERVQFDASCTRRYHYETVETRVWRSAVTHEELHSIVYHGDLLRRALQAAPMDADLELSTAIAALAAGAISE